MMEEDRSSAARSARSLLCREAEERAIAQRQAFRAVVFQEALESAITTRFRQADPASQQMFVLSMEPSRGLGHLFADHDARRNLESQCALVQARAGIGVSQDGLNPISVYMDAFDGQVRDLASQVVSRMRDAFQRARMRQGSTRSERLQQEFARTIVEGANEGSIPLGVVRAFAICADLSRHLLATGVLSRSSLRLLDAGFHNRFLDGEALTDVGVEFFRGIQCRLLTMQELDAATLFSRIEKELGTSEPVMVLHELAHVPPVSSEEVLLAA